LRFLAADKVRDEQALREASRELGIRPLNKPRIFAPYDHTRNARTDEQRYNQRSITGNRQFGCKALARLRRASMIPIP